MMALAPCTLPLVSLPSLLPDHPEIYHITVHEQKGKRDPFPAAVG